MGSCFGKSLKEKERELMNYLRHVDEKMMTMNYSISNIETYIEMLVEQIKHSHEKDFRERFWKLANELLASLQNDWKRHEREAFQAVGKALQKVPFKSKEFRNVKFRIDAFLQGDIGKDNEHSRLVEKDYGGSYSYGTFDLVNKHGRNQSQGSFEKDTKQNTVIITETRKKELEEQVNAIKRENEALCSKRDDLVMRTYELHQHLTHHEDDSKAMHEQINCLRLENEQLEKISDNAKQTLEEIFRIVQRILTMCEINEQSIPSTQTMHELDNEDADLIQGNEDLVPLNVDNDKRVSAEKEESLKQNELVPNIRNMISCVEKQLPETLRQLRDIQLEACTLKRSIENKEQRIQEVEICLKSEKENHEKTNETLISIQLQLQEDSREAREAKHELEKTKQTLQEETLRLATLQQENLSLHMRISEMQKDIESLEKKHKTATDENIALQEELEKLKQKPICRVQVFSQHQGDKPERMEKEIISLIRNKLDDEMGNVEIIQCKTKAELNQNAPMLLLCMNMSRLGTEVLNTLQGLQPNPKMAVVVFHHKDAHALPRQASERVLVDKEFKALGGIFDIAFLSDKGIYPCPMNEENISKLIHFIMQQKLQK